MVPTAPTTGLMAEMALQAPAMAAEAERSWDGNWDPSWDGNWDPGFQGMMPMPAVPQYPSFVSGGGTSSSTMCKFYAQNRCLKGDLCPFQHGPPLELPSCTGTELPAAFQALRVLAPQQPGGPPPVASLPQLPRGGSQGPPLPQMPVNAAASLPTLAPVLPTAPTEPALATPSALPAPTAQPVSMAPVTSTPSATAQPPEAPTTQPTAPVATKAPKLCKLYDMGGCTKGADCPNCHGQEELDAVQRALGQTPEAA
ncbi:unnamed protein product [Durusdinium trenchii]